MTVANNLLKKILGYIGRHNIYWILKMLRKLSIYKPIRHRSISWTLRNHNCRASLVMSFGSGFIVVTGDNKSFWIQLLKSDFVLLKSNFVSSNFYFWVMPQSNTVGLHLFRIGVTFRMGEAHVYYSY